MKLNCEECKVETSSRETMHNLLQLVGKLRKEKRKLIELLNKSRAKSSYPTEKWNKEKDEIYGKINI